jgi:hypothetical protein
MQREKESQARVRNVELLKLDRYIKERYEPVLLGIKKFEEWLKEGVVQFVFKGTELLEGESEEEQVQIYKELLSFLSYIVGEKDVLHSYMTEALKHMIVALRFDPEKLP